MNMQPILVVNPQNGKCYPSGYAYSGGGVCPCSAPTRWTAQPPASYDPRAFAVLSPQALQQALATSAQNPALANQFQAVDLPNRGVAQVARTEGPSSPNSGISTFTLILDNSDPAVTTESRVILGDYGDVYELMGNVQTLDAGFVFGGTFGTQTASVFNARSLGRAWSVKSMQFQALDEGFYSGNNIVYFDTQPTKNNPTVYNLDTATLLSPNQFNPKIQNYNYALYFDGVNGLDIRVPVGEKVTVLFNLQAERGATSQVLLPN